MPAVYVKGGNGTKPEEFSLENVEEYAVAELREAVAGRLHIPLETTCLIYAGRVLKPGKNLGYYKVVDGCTVHLLRKEIKKKVDDSSRAPRRGLGSIISNRRVQTMLGRILSNPTRLNAMIAGTPLASNPDIQATLSNPELMASLGNPDAIADYMRSNPQIASLLETMLRMYTMFIGAEEEEEMVDVVEASLEEDMELAEDESMRRLASQQEQMFEYSQARQAHRSQGAQSRHGGTASQAQDVSYQASSSQQHGTVEPSDGRPPSISVATGGSITQDMLSSALAGALAGTPGPSSFSSLDVDVGSGPSSLSSIYTDSFSQPPSLSTPSISVPQSESPQAMGRSEQAGSVTSVGEGRITEATLQEALSSAMSSLQRQTSQGSQSGAQVSQPGAQGTQSGAHRSQSGAHGSQSGAHGSQSGAHGSQSGAQESSTLSSLKAKYQAQLEQLHRMGILDDAACLHTLEAVAGDINAALEVLMGGPH